MGCRSCKSTNQQIFPSEISVHAGSRDDNFNLPQLLIYPEVLICLDWGHSEFPITEETLRELRGL
jgi:hypothetical protein